MFPALLDSVFLENNGLKDRQMATLMQGFSSLTRLRRFGCQNNEMMQNSFYFLNKLIEKQSPNNLEELRLTSCKLSQAMTDELLDLIKDDCALKKLSIVNCGMHS